MKAANILVSLFLICFVLSRSAFAHAEVQGELFEDGVVTVDGENFNLDKFNEAFNAWNINETESVYNEWLKRRQKMLKNGIGFGIFDAYLKHCYAKILYMKENYEQCIATEDEILNYLFANPNKNDINWISLVYNGMYRKKYSYDKVQDYESSLHVQQAIVQFMESRYPLNHPTLLKDRMSLSLCYTWVKDYQTATAVDEDLLPRVKKVFGVNSDETRKVKLYLAWDYRCSLRYSDSIKLYEEILKSDIKLYGKADEKTLYSYNKLKDVKILLAEDYHNSSKFSDAAKLYEEVLKSDIEFYGETDEKTLDSYDSLINEYLALFKLEEMGSLLERAVPLAEQNLKDDSDLKFFILMKQAIYYSATRQMQKASELCERMLAMPIDNENKIGPLIWLAENCLISEDYSNAIHYALMARDIYEKNFPENKTLRLIILTVTSQIYTTLGNNSEGLKFAQEAFDLSVELFGHDSLEVFNVIGTLAGCYQKMDQYDEALKLWKEGYELGRKLYGDNTMTTIMFMINIAGAYYNLDDNESGIVWAEEALNESMRLYGEKNICTLTAWMIFADFCDENKATRDNAIKILEKVLKTSSEVCSENDPLTDSAMWSLARAYKKTSRWQVAIPLYEKIIARHETLMTGYRSLTFNEKKNLISENSSAYVNVAELYYRAGNFKDAFRTLERGRSRLLIDAYSEQLAKSSGIFEEQEILKLNEYKAGLANYSNLIEKAFQAGDEQARFNLENAQRDLINEYAKYKESLQNKYPKYKTVSQANKLDIEHDKNILPDDTAFVEFMVYSSKTLVAFMFDKSGDIKAVKINTPKDFNSTCSLYRELLAYPHLQAMDKDGKYLLKFPDGNCKIINGANAKKGSGAELLNDEKAFNELKQNLSKRVGEILLSPLKDYISGYSNLIISPDEDLNNIPFETLEFNGKLAIEYFNISYVPSFSVLKLMHEAGEKNSKLTARQDLFAMGNAFYGDNDESASRGSLNDFFKTRRGKFDVTELRDLKWENLAGTKDEIDRVSKMFDTKKIFSKRAASESNLKAFNRRDEISKYKYLLFAAHGIFIPYAPEYSSIVLSQGVDPKEDGYVTVGEWMGLNLNSDLVFLSACESGLGEYQVGEGIVGIPYALTIAGNKNTVMSIWKVDDGATAEFVSTFFEKLSKGKSASVALNETKREFLKSKNTLHQNPAVWAAFLLYGF